jgi:hypothetical protein
MGNKTKSERLLLSENILPMQAGNNFIKGEGDYLEQSELGFGIFLLVILISR